MDDEYEATDEDLDAEAQVEPVMMQNADRWENFLEYVDLYMKPWADEEHDTDIYRKRRAVELFNAGHDYYHSYYYTHTTTIQGCARLPVQNPKGGSLASC